MKEYVLKFYVDEDGKIRCDAENTGFNVIELVGMMEWKIQDFVRQMNKEVQATRVFKVEEKE